MRDFALASHSSRSRASCPHGYEKIWQDLNQGAGGNYNYLCLRRSGSNPPVTAIRFLRFNHAVSGSSYSGWQLYNQDLLKTSGGKYCYVGYKTSFIEKRSAISQRLYKFNFTVTEEDYNTLPETPQPHKSFA